MKSYPALKLLSSKIMIIFRNFTVAKKAAQNDKFGNIVQAKQEMGMTKEQQEDAKRVS